MTRRRFPWAAILIVVLFMGSDVKANNATTGKPANGTGLGPDEEYYYDDETTKAATPPSGLPPSPPMLIEELPEQDEVHDYYNPEDEVDGEVLRTEFRITGEHMHKHPPKKDHDMYKTVMRFSYDEKDELGPKNWGTIPGALLTSNECGANIYSPINIKPEECTIRDPNLDQIQIEIQKPSLHFDTHKTVEQNPWYFGHPTDGYFGIEIKAGSFGLFQVRDDYDSHHLGEGSTAIQYDFLNAAIMYCNHSKASKERSSHQIKGKKYPFEIYMMFYSVTPSTGLESITFGEGKGQFVIVTVLGQIAKKDNPVLAPLVKAAHKFSGPSYKEDWSTIPIPGPFSPSWLLPRNSSYFYYAGSFPVPPCYVAPRIYVLEKPIPISKSQLSAFTSIKTQREKSGKLPCTQGFIRHNFRPEEILFNNYKIKIEENDKKPKGRAVDPDEPDSKGYVLTGLTTAILISILAILIR